MSFSSNLFHLNSTFSFSYGILVSPRSSRLLSLPAPPSTPPSPLHFPSVLPHLGGAYVKRKQASAPWEGFSVGRSGRSGHSAPEVHESQFGPEAPGEDMEPGNRSCAPLLLSRCFAAERMIELHLVVRGLRVKGGERQEVKNEKTNKGGGNKRRKYKCWWWYGSWIINRHMKANSFKWRPSAVQCWSVRQVGRLETFKRSW